MTQELQIPLELLQYAVEVVAAAPMILSDEILAEMGDQQWMDGLHSMVATAAKRNWDAEFAQVFREEVLV